MIRPAGRLFWKSFLLIAIVQICSDQAVHQWSTHRYPSGAEFNERSPTPPKPFVIPEMVDVVASLGCAALLAWLLSKPISNLRSALSDAAGGNLDTRVADRMGFGTDELKDLGTEFDRMMHRMQTLLTAQRRLLHDVSHEIRSPMARIQAAVGLAHRQPDQALALMGRIERECIRVDRLVDEMLALSRLQAGVDNRLSEEFDVHELARRHRRRRAVRSVGQRTIDQRPLRRPRHHSRERLPAAPRVGECAPECDQVQQERLRHRSGDRRGRRGPLGGDIGAGRRHRGSGVRSREYFRAVFPQPDTCAYGGQRLGSADRQAGGSVPWRHDPGAERPDRRTAGGRSSCLC